MEAISNLRTRIRTNGKLVFENQTWLNNITTGEYASYYEKQYMWINCESMSSTWINLWSKIA
jgi:hypothetical protein